MMPNIPPPGPEELTAIQRVTRKIQLPLVSGKASVVAIFLCVGVAAGLVFLMGTAMHFAPWVRVELMLAAWWVVWSATLSHFLYHGHRVSDDHQYAGPRSWLPKMGGSKQPAARSSGGSGWPDIWYVGGDSEGCAWVVGIILAAVAVFFLAWLLIEIVIPVLALILYALIRGMLAKVANDTRGCVGRFGTALLWGTVWATVYTAPLALLVWAVHLIVTNKAGAVG